MPQMPCTEGGLPVAIDRLFGLVKLGITECAVLTVPFAFTRSSAGISPAEIAASR